MSTKIRNLTNIDGVNVPAPTSTGFDANALVTYASDAAFEAAIAPALPIKGMTYFNTTENVVRQYNGTAWQYDKTIFSWNANSTLTGANQDFTPNTTDQAYRFTNASLASIRSIVPVAGQKSLIICNDTGAANFVMLKNEDTGATAANRIVTGTGMDFVLEPSRCAILAYDEDALRWRVTSGDSDKVTVATVADSTTTGANQDITPGNYQVIRFTQGALTSIRSISPSIHRVIYLTNGQASQAITIQNENTGATAASRIVTGTGADFSLAVGQMVSLIYDSVGQRWRLAGAASSGGGVSANLCTSPTTATGWFSSAAVAAATTTTPAELPLAGPINSAIKITRTTVGSYDEWRWEMPLASRNTVIPILWSQITEAAYTSGQFKVDVYVYTDATYTDGTKTRKALRSDISSVTSIPAGNGQFGTGNIVSFDANATDVYYGMRITRVSGSNFISITKVQIGQADFGVAPANGRISPIFTFEGSAPAATRLDSQRNLNWLTTIGWFDDNAPAATTAAIVLPSGMTIDNAIFINGACIVGTWQREYSGAASDIMPSQGISGFIFYDGTTTNKLFFARQAGGGAFIKLLGTTVGNGEDVSVDFTIPISEWSGASNPLIVGPGNAVEYLSHDGTSQATDWALVPNIAGAANSTAYTIIPRSPCQNGDTLEIELRAPASNDILTNNAYPWINGSSSFLFGMQSRKLTNGNISITFGNAGFSPTAGLGAAAAGNTWADFRATGWMWRVRKVQAGIPAGVAIAKQNESGFVNNQTSGASLASTDLTAQTNITINPGDVVLCKWIMTNNVVTFFFNLSAVSVTAAANFLFTLPSSVPRPLTNFYAPCTVFDNSGSSFGIHEVRIDPSGIISFSKAGGSNWLASTDNTYIRGQISWMII